VKRVREAVRAMLKRGTGGVFPGGVAAVARGREWLIVEAAGDAQVTPVRRAMTPETIFDLASLTKPVATATAVLQLYAGGLIDLDAPVARYVPAFDRGRPARRVTVRQLLAHSSGLPAWEMLYLPAPPGAGRRGPGARACRSIPQAVRRIGATPLHAPPGRRDEYSDLGFIVLGHLVERLTGQPLGAYVRREIFRPLAMRTTRFAPPRAWRGRCAATEIGNVFERTRAAEQGLGWRFRWRRHLLRGEVHDGNAWYVGRGVAGHAGLFSAASDLIRFGRAMLAGGALAGARVLPPAIVAEAVRDHGAPRAEIRRGLGWVVKGATPYGGRRATPAAHGHTGFTGTSLLIDPPRDLVIVLLTNRVHPGAFETAINVFRPAFYDAVIEAVDG
jgi:CubicO group peptidase (beta-lactamase class C family)